MNKDFHLQSLDIIYFLAVTLDLMTDDFCKRSYLDIHAVWINTEFEIEHCLLAMKHFGTERHTGDAIMNATYSVFEKYDIGDPNQITITTDRGSNVVNAFQHSTRLDCFDHRLHTTLCDAWSAAMENTEIKLYDSAASNLCSYVRSCSGLQEQLPVPMKSPCITRTWTSLYERCRCIHGSAEALRPILQSRDKMCLFLSVDFRFNEELLNFLSNIRSIFLRLEQIEKPSIQNVVPSYYSLTAMCCSASSDMAEMRIVKKKWKLLWR